MSPGIFWIWPCPKCTQEIPKARAFPGVWSWGRLRESSAQNLTVECKGCTAGSKQSCHWFEPEATLSTNISKEQNQPQCLS